jgi:general nucleoside transport system permease protein
MIRVERWVDAPRWLRACVPAISLALAAIIAGLVLALTGHDPFATYGQMYDAAFVARGGMTGTFVYATPLMFTGLCAAIAFRMRAWNIGGEGQLYLGAIGASGVGLALGGWPAPVIFVGMAIGGAVAGLVWAAIPGILRAYGRTNEILTSLMLNYVAGFLMYYLIYDSSSYWRDLTSPSAKVFPLGKYLVGAASWPAFNLGTAILPFGFLVGIVAAGLLWTLIRTTGFGFEMRVVGDSPKAADYAGIRTKRRILTVMAISGAIAGLGGASQIGDFGHVLDPRGLQQAGYGYTGIVVAALSLYEPLAVILVAFLLGALTNAGFALQGPTFPPGLVGVMEGIILFCVLGGELLVRYRVRLQRRPTGPVAPLDHALVSPSPSQVAEVKG